MTTTELLDLNFEHEGGLEEFARKVVASDDVKSMFNEFRRIILAAYGERSADGKRFIKSDIAREEFEQSAAYDALFVELSSNATSLADFLKGIVPADVAREIERAEQAEQAQVVNLPPLPPSES
jgi:hypothetical protein